jgi:hypothetical protein
MLQEVNILSLAVYGSKVGHLTLIQIILDSTVTPDDFEVPRRR